MNKLNLGCGYVNADVENGWWNVDKIDYGFNRVEDVLKGLFFPGDSFDFVLMNHTLQMFTYEELPVVLEEVRRVMKPKAKIRILTPDLELAIGNFISGDIDFFPIADDIEPTLDGKFARYLYWHGDTRCGFTYDGLKDLLHRNGFKGIRKAKFGECELDSREEESLIVEGYK